MNNTMYLLVAAMEIEMKDCLGQLSHEQVFNLKERAMERIMCSEEVKFHWQVLSCNWEPEKEQALLPLIAGLWVTMRGFAYASGWMEGYKQQTKSTIQKSKGLRKKL